MVSGTAASPPALAGRPHSDSVQSRIFFSSDALEKHIRPLHQRSATHRRDLSACDSGLPIPAARHVLWITLTSFLPGRFAKELPRFIDFETLGTVVPAAMLLA